MAKKKRSRRSSSAKNRKKSQRLASKGAQANSGAKKPTASKAVDFAGEYHYVLGDLKRIAILAAAMFGLLVILALVIR